MYHAGWAWAGSTPYRSTKLVGAHFGGIRQPMAVSWPKKVKADPTPRPQFHHVIDIAPTIYDVVKITPPRVVNGIPQDNIDGVSLAYTFDDASAKGQRVTQFFDIMGSRSIYHDGWMASAFGPRVPWEQGNPNLKDWDPREDTWELYNLEEDWTQADDLAAKMPEKLAHMKELFMIESARNKNLPIGGGLYIAAIHPDQRLSTPYTHCPYAGVYSSQVGWRLEPGRRPGRYPGKRQWRAVRARGLFGRRNLLRQRWSSVVRVQPL
jgi:arylsulfatase